MSKKTWPERIDLRTLSGEEWLRLLIRGTNYGCMRWMGCELPSRGVLIRKPVSDVEQRIRRSPIAIRRSCSLPDSPGRRPDRVQMRSTAPCAGAPSLLTV